MLFLPSMSERVSTRHILRNGIALLGMTAAIGCGNAPKNNTDHAPVAPATSATLNQHDGAPTNSGPSRGSNPPQEGRTVHYGQMVKDTEFQNIDIFERASFMQNAINETATESHCTANVGFPAFQGEAYAYAHNHFRRIPVYYEPGDKYLHASTEHVPTGVDYKDMIFGYFNGKKYQLPGTHEYLKGDYLGNDLALKIPAEVGTPPHLYSPCPEGNN